MTTTTTKPRPPRLMKRQQDFLLNNIRSVLEAYRNRAISHVDMAVPRDVAIRALVNPDDVEVIERAAQLLGYCNKSPDFVQFRPLEVVDLPGANKPVKLHFVIANMDWMPPAYLQGKHSVSELPESFVPTFAPIAAQVAEIDAMYMTARAAVDALVKLCDDKLNRMRALWPALDVIANASGVNLDLLPKPNGLPPLSPDLREGLQTATLFQNSVMMMPPWVGRKYGVFVSGL